MSATLQRLFACGEAALVMAFAAVGLAAAAAAPKPVTHSVTIDATTYLPKTVTVAVGDSIVWVNKDLLVHTVTARDGSFDSHDIPPGKSWTYTVKATGLSAYHCVYHVTMKGTLRVR